MDKEDIAPIVEAQQQYNAALLQTRHAIRQWFTANQSEVLTQESVRGSVRPRSVIDMMWDDQVWLDIVKADKNGIYTETGYLKPWDHLAAQDLMSAAQWVYDVLNALYFECDEDPVN